jgi:hypothetical protein
MVAQSCVLARPQPGRPIRRRRRFCYSARGSRSGYFSWSKAAGSRRWAHCHLIIKVTNAWSYTSIKKQRLTRVCTANTLHLLIAFNITHFLLISYGSTALYGPGPPRFVDASRSHSVDTPHSVGLLWTSDQPVAETSTWHHTTLTTDRHPCPRRNSTPQSQQASGRRPTS